MSFGLKFESCSNNCICPSPSPSPSVPTFPQTPDCSACPDGAPVEWEFTLSGVTAGSCVTFGSTCTQHNTTFILSENDSTPCGCSGSTCCWKFTGPFACCTLGCAGCHWSMDLNTPQAVGSVNYYIVQFFDTSQDVSPIRYGIPVDDFDCLGPNILEYIDDGNTGCNWPATATLDPA